MALVVATSAFQPKARAVKIPSGAPGVSSPPARLPTQLSYDGTGKRPTEVGDSEEVENLGVRVLGPPFAFVVIILIASQIVHFK